MVRRAACAARTTGREREREEGTGAEEQAWHSLGSFALLELPQRRRHGRHGLLGLLGLLGRLARRSQLLSECSAERGTKVGGRGSRVLPRRLASAGVKVVGSLLIGHLLPAAPTRLLVHGLGITHRHQDGLARRRAARGTIAEGENPADALDKKNKKKEEDKYCSLSSAHDPAQSK